MPTVDWERIRAEYIAGGTTFRALAKKYGVTKDAIGRRAKAEGWGEKRDATATKVRQATERKIIERRSDECADNAAVAMRIRAKLLKRLESEIDALPERMGTESAREVINTGTGKRTVVSTRIKLRDLAAAYKDLTADMDLADTETEDIDLTRAEVYGDENAEV